VASRKPKIRTQPVHSELGRAAAQIFTANDHINQLLIENLSPAAWRAKPLGKVRTIAAIFNPYAQRPHQVAPAHRPAPESSATNSTAPAALRNKPAPV